MKIFVKAKPMARKESVEKIDNTNFIVWVKEPPKDGKANQAVIKALAEYFGVSQQNVRILIGQTSRQKIIAINK